jgi:hypothetical protein
MQPWHLPWGFGAQNKEEEPWKAQKSKQQKQLLTTASLESA